MRVVILGAGRVGARVARELVQDPGNEVAVIDWNPLSFERLGSDFSGEAVLGNGIDVDFLRRAGAGQADLFLALTNGDNRNLMAGQVARFLGAQHVVVRVYDPVRAAIFREYGIETISPTMEAAERLRELVVSGAEEG